MKKYFTLKLFRRLLSERTFQYDFTEKNISSHKKRARERKLVRERLREKMKDIGGIREERQKKRERERESESTRE